MSDAPKNGARLLMVNCPLEVVIGYWNGRQWMDQCEEYGIQPIYWHPLPLLPAIKGLTA